MSKLALLKTHDAQAAAFISSLGEQSQVRGLFLGTGESGKSTVFKQMRLNYGREFDSAERSQYRKVIWAELLRGMRTVLDQMTACDGLYLDFELNPALNHSMRVVQSLDLTDNAIISSDQDQSLQRYFGASEEPAPGPYQYSVWKELDGRTESRRPEMIPLYEGAPPTRPEVAAAIHALWTQSTSIREFVRTGRAEIEHNMSYFFDKVLEFASGDREPTDEDILKARIKTTGLISDTFLIKGNPLVVVDVGGQRTERKKWMHCFDNATCVLFVVSVADYANGGLEESLKVFQEVMTNSSLSDKPVALFLNKMDILVRNLRLFPFQEYQRDFQGNPLSVDEVIGYVEKLYRNATSLPSSSIYTYRTCATDRHAMQFVVEAVTNMIFIENLKWAGMM